MAFVQTSLFSTMKISPSSKRVCAGREGSRWSSISSVSTPTRLTSSWISLSISGVERLGTDTTALCPSGRPSEVEQDSTVGERTVGGHCVDTETPTWLQIPGIDDDPREHEFVNLGVAYIAAIRVPMVRRVEVRTDRRLKRKNSSAAFVSSRSARLRFL